MVDQSFTMNVNDTLELDYLIEEISRDTIKVTDEPTADSSSVSYISRETGVFNPSETGTHKLDIDGQIIEIEVTDIPDSGIFRYDFEDDSDSSTAIDAFADDSHTAYDGSISGATYSSTARWGDFGLSFSGSDSLTTPLTYGDLPSPYSYGVWVYPNESPPWSKDMHLLGSGWALNFRLPSGRSDLELKTFSSEGGNANSIYSSVNLSGNSWNFVGFSLTSDTGTLVVDGSVDNSGTGYHSSENNSLDVTTDLYGLLDRPSAYSKELTSTEWTDLYNYGYI
jgi:hypothetical protein